MFKSSTPWGSYWGKRAGGHVWLSAVSHQPCLVELFDLGLSPLSFMAGRCRS